MSTIDTGTAQPVEAPDIVEAIWGIELQTSGCPACRHSFLFPKGRVDAVCPNCGQASLVSQPALLRNEPPELVVPFEKSQGILLPVYESFTRGVWLHTPDFTPQLLLSRAVQVYWPMWLVDCQVSGSWQAEVGYDYQVQSSQESYQSGGWHTREKVETRIRWEPRLGQIDRPYSNIPVPALSNHRHMSQRSGAYRLEAAKPYAPNLLGTSAIHLPDQNPENSWGLAKDSLNRVAGEDCAAASSAQHVRQVQVNAEYTSQHWTQLLLPLYVSYYHDDENKVHLVWINGQSGSVNGVRMASQRKGWQVAGILAAIAVLLFLLAVAGGVLTPIIPPAGIIGGLFGVLALLVGASALVPAIWPWMFNRSNEA